MLQQMIIKTHSTDWFKLSRKIANIGKNARDKTREKDSRRAGGGLTPKLTLTFT